MPSAIFSLRRYPLIFVVKTAQNRPRDDLASRWRAGPSGRPRGAVKTECGMRPRLARRAHPVNAPDTDGILPPHKGSAEHLPITQRVDGDIEGSNGTPVGGLLLQGWPGQLPVPTLQIRMEFCHPTSEGVRPREEGRRRLPRPSAALWGALGGFVLLDLHVLPEAPSIH
jgi:hypothetical protein